MPSCFNSLGEMRIDCRLSRFHPLDLGADRAQTCFKPDANAEEVMLGLCTETKSFVRSRAHQRTDQCAIKVHGRHVIDAVVPCPKLPRHQAQY